MSATRRKFKPTDERKACPTCGEPSRVIWTRNKVGLRIQRFGCRQCKWWKGGKKIVPVELLEPSPH